MIPKKTLLRLHILGHWSAREFWQNLSTIEEIYNLIFIINRINTSQGELWPDEPLTEPLSFDKYINENERLSVRKIRYASPGKIDLLGLGTITGHIKDLIIFIIEHRVKLKSIELDERKRVEEIRQLSIENASRIIELAEKVGCSKGERRRLFNSLEGSLTRIANLVNANKIGAIELLDEQGKDLVDPEERTNGNEDLCDLDDDDLL